MEIVEAVLLCCCGVLCFLTSYSDFTRGVVDNRLIICGLIFAILLDVVLYGVLLSEAKCCFLINLLVAVILAFALYGLNVWAAGDCKLFIVLTALFPLPFYPFVGEYFLGSVAPFVVAFLVGYAFIVCMGVRIAVKIGRDNLASEVRASAKRTLSYWLATILLLSLIRSLISIIFPDIFVIVPALMIAASCCSSFLTITFDFFRSRAWIASCFFAVLAVTLLFRTNPLAVLNISNIVVMIAIGFAKVVAAKAFYIQIDCSAIKPGDILSTASSILLSTKLPKLDLNISNEGPQDRLSNCDAQAIRAWGLGRGSGFMIDIVRKVPFALFIDAGFIITFIWGVIQRCCFG